MATGHPLSYNQQALLAIPGRCYSQSLILIAWVEPFQNQFKLSNLLNVNFKLRTAAP